MVTELEAEVEAEVVDSIFLRNVLVQQIYSMPTTPSHNV